MKTTKSGRTFCKIFSLTLLALCIALTFIACGENFMVTDFLGGKNSGSKPLPELTVTAPAFDDVYPAYIQPAALSIVITNTGNLSATIPTGGVTVPAGSDFTIVGTGSSVVGANSSIANWRVRPKSGLAVGTHTAEITVKYDSNATATATVTFVVMQPGAATRKLTVTAPAFDDVYAKYTQPVAQNIIITNTGNTTATIAETNGVTVSVSTITPTPNPVPNPLPTTFTIGTGTRMVGANSSIANWTVRPNAALAAGTYKATITVTYDGTSGNTATATVTFVVMARERFVAVANGTAATYSSDGINWKQSTMPNANWTSVTYGNGKYVAVGTNSSIAYSTNGINWTSQSVSGYWNSVTYGEGIFVAVSNGSKKAIYSSDGSTWAEAELPTSTNWWSVAYGNGVFVAIAYNNAAAYSTDYGRTWASTPLGANEQYPAWCSVTYGNGMFVAVSTVGKVARSINGSSWTEQTITGSVTQCHSVTYGNGRFVIVPHQGTAVYSTDGTIWIAIPLATESWWSVAFGNGMFVAIGYNTTSVAYSTDNGNSWTRISPLLQKCNSVTYGVVER